MARMSVAQLTAELEQLRASHERATTELLSLRTRCADLERAAWLRAAFLRGERSLVKLVQGMPAPQRQRFDAWLAAYLRSAVLSGTERRAYAQLLLPKEAPAEAPTEALAEEAA